MQFKPSVIQTQNFKEFTEPMLHFLVILINNNNEDLLKESISKVFDVCLLSPHFMKKKFDVLINVMSRVRQIDQDENSNLKIESVECLVNVIEKYPDLGNQ